MFPNNDDHNNTNPGPVTGWGDWLGTEAAAESHQHGSEPQPSPNGAEVHPPAGAGAWSSWLSAPASTSTQDSGVAAAEAEAEPSSAPRKNRRALLIAGGGAVVAVGVVTAGVVALMSTQTPTPALPTPAVSTPPASPTASTPTDPTLGGGPGCEPLRNANVVRGNGTGGTNSGPDVILAFQHAYYVTRSATAARALTTPDAQVSPVEAIEAGIATIPVGTRYCLTITPSSTEESTYAVVIIETRPDSQVRTYQQTVSVTSRDNKTLITRIGAAQ